MTSAGFIELVGSIDPNPIVLFAPAADLTQFAVRFRYPGDDPPAPQEALPWLELAQSVVEEVRHRLSEHRHADEPLPSSRPVEPPPDSAN